MKYLGIIKYILIAISVLVIVIPFITAPANSDPDVNTMLRWTYLMLGVAIAAIVILPLFNLAKNPGGAVRSLVGLGIVAVVGLIAFALSSAEPVRTITNVYEDHNELVLSDTGLIMTYISFGAAVLCIVVTEIINAFK